MCFCPLGDLDDHRLLAQLPLFDSSILEPDLDLALGQAERAGQELSIVAHEIHLLQELILQASELFWRESCPDAFSFFLDRVLSDADRLRLIGMV